MTENIPRTRAVAALRFRALGDETRLRLLEILVDGEQTVGALTDETQLGQSLVSHHLRTLRDAGLVVTRRDGRWIHYTIAAAAMASVRGALDALQR
ncbi:MAG: metalloregulator ArsR/SmtB family transcription factor [Gemmatimonadota bacterium]|nr:metalloregulator ArsR/SmtB family transcription factor [Gemmatimonadota bacterium]